MDYSNVYSNMMACVACFSSILYMKLKFIISLSSVGSLIVHAFL